MPKLRIDNRTIEVSEGTKVIDAAERAGIMIPRFCYHRALGAVGACRLCAVNCLDGPYRGLQMSCMIDALDGLVVSTTHPEAVEFRKFIIEGLMMNHPHDCPVCDEGGHCLLQDMTESAGHGQRRYLGQKRTYVDQYLGPLVYHEMNRCIQCYRCARYYQEFAGYRDLGVLGIAGRVFFGRHREGVLESPFAGNLIDICPTGVYTDKPSRYTGRRWNFQRSPGVCIHCSLGCHMTVSTRYRTVVRMEARYSEAVNGWFVCDRGRYGYFYASNADRPRKARIDGGEASVEAAVAAASDRLKKGENGAGTACIGSVRSSLETMQTLVNACRANKWPLPVCWQDDREAGAVNRAVSGLSRKNAISLRDIESADCVLVLGADPVNEAPMLVMALRQAARKGASVWVADPRPIELPFFFHHLPMHPQEMSSRLGALMDHEVKTRAGEETEKDPPTVADASIEHHHQKARTRMDALRSDLLDSSRAVVVCGTDIVDESVPEFAAALSRYLNTSSRKCGLFYTLPGGDAYGAALFLNHEATVESLLSDIENGSVRQLLVVECDPLGRFPDRGRIERAFSRLDFLAVVDCVETETTLAAHVFLPAQTVFESGGAYLNQEGRLQRMKAVHAGGLSIRTTGNGDHPPRIFQENIPGGDPMSPAHTIAAMSGASPAGLPAPIHEADVDSLLPFLVNTAPIDAQHLADGAVRLFRKTGDGNKAGEKTLFEPLHGESDAEKMTPILVDLVFGTEPLSARSNCLKELEPDPRIFISGYDAAALYLSDGDAIEIGTDAGGVTGAVSVRDNMAKGIIVVPRHRKLNWQEIGSGKIVVSHERITKKAE